MTSIHTSFQTNWGRLHNLNLCSKSPAVCVLLTGRQRQTRMQRCRAHQGWTRRQWGLILFSDESRFCLTWNDHHIHIWRRPREELTSGCVWEHDCNKSGSLVVWGGIHLHGFRTPLRLTGARSRNEIVRPLSVMRPCKPWDRVPHSWTTTPLRTAPGWWTTTWGSSKFPP
jgi:hypothetical protein